MKHSIRNQFLLIIIGIISLALFIIGVLNYFLLDNFYEKDKQKKILSAYEQLCEPSIDYTNIEVGQTLMQFSSEHNINILVCDEDFQTIFSSTFDNEDFSSRLFGYYTGLYKDDVNVIKNTSSYIIQKTYDKFRGLNYLEIWGRISNGEYLIIRTPIESIHESVKISNRFFYLIGGLIVLLTFFAVLYISKQFTKPITELTEISSRIASLDFDAKYKVNINRHNEIDIMGEHFNELSTKLETTISELKSANIKLMSDVEEKTKIDNMRKEFVHNVSHELKTPIAIIQGYSEGLKDGIADDEESRNYYCDIIIDEANKMNHLVRQLLDLNDLESGKDAVDIVRFDINSLIVSVIANMKILIEQNDVSIFYDSSKPVYVWGDEFKIEQVFTNYLSNALNHVSGEKKIDIKVVKNDDKVRVSVFNTGTPIPEESLEHIWEKFYKIDKARTREYGGSGIGLSIVKAIMENHKQKYGVVNYDNGVAFYFELDSSNTM